MSKDTLFVKEITVKDDKCELNVQLLIFKDCKSGGLFGIDSSFIEQNFEDDEVIKVVEPFNNTLVILDV